MPSHRFGGQSLRPGSSSFTSRRSHVKTYSSEYVSASRCGTPRPRRTVLRRRTENPPRPISLLSSGNTASRPPLGRSPLRMPSSQPSRFRTSSAFCMRTGITARRFPAESAFPSPRPARSHPRASEATPTALFQRFPFSLSTAHVPPTTQSDEIGPL